MRLLTEPKTVLITEQTAWQLQLNEQSTLKAMINQRTQTLQVVGFINNSALFSQQQILLADIATAQELTGMIGTLDSHCAGP